VTPFPQQPSLLRTFHQTRLWRAEADGKSDEAKAAGEVDIIKEPVEPTTDAATQPGPSSAAEDAVSEAAGSTAAPEAPQPTSPPASDSSLTAKAQDLAASAAQTARDAFSNLAPSSSSSQRGRNPTAAPTSRPMPSPSRILYVGNLFFEVTAPQLEKEFSSYGPVTNSRIVTDARGLSKGFGYVEFADQSGADEALRNLDQKVFMGRRLAVQYHIKREPRTMGRPPREPAPPSKTLFIGNMSYQMSDKDLNGTILPPSPGSSTSPGS
jgi:nucleolin